MRPGTLVLMSLYLIITLESWLRMAAISHGSSLDMYQSAYVTMTSIAILLPNGQFRSGVMAYVRYTVMPVATTRGLVKIKD